VGRVQFSPDGRYLASSGGKSPSVLLTNLKTEETRDIILGGLPWTYSRDGRYLLTSVGDALRLWSLPPQ